jgi:NTE family protein
MNGIKQLFVSIIKLLIGSTFLLSSSFIYSQKIGLVLSGGGATGFAHIGVLKALEENNIPIDYITGTSSGALIGGLYAIGYSPSEIETYVKSKRFETITKGELEVQNNYFFNKDETDASLLHLSFSADSAFKRFLPTKFMNSTFLDYEMLTTFGPAGEIANEDFSKLFIPFRCVASDISNKKCVVLKNGKLNLAIRASMTFPFFIQPIKFNNQLLFDGGLYNNFPADVMVNDFNPDFIIGSNVSSNYKSPEEHDLLSQLINMMVIPTDFSIPEGKGIIIAPKTNVTTFNFSDIESAINAGYTETLEQLEQIKKYISIAQNKAIFSKKRTEYREKLTGTKIVAVESTSSDKKLNHFVQRNILPNKLAPDSITFAKRYFRLNSYEGIEFLTPSLTRIKDSNYLLTLKPLKAKEFGIEIGGVFSSKAINTGYIGLSYLLLKNQSLKIKGDSYFGRFYGAAKLLVDYKIPTTYQIGFSPYFVLNRWDYFKSFSSFFEDVKPSYLIQNEMYYGIQLKHPIGNIGKSVFDLRNFTTNDQYYQTENFSTKDTSDFTLFSGYSIKWVGELNTLNRKQFASKGKLLSVKVQFVDGTEDSESGSSSSNRYKILQKHNWFSIQGEGQWFIFNNNTFNLGLHMKGVMSNQPLFYNYKASLLAMNDFSPFVDAQSTFLQEYRSNKHIGIGTNLIFSIKKNIDFRIDGYLYQAFNQLNQNNALSFYYERPQLFKDFLLASHLIYHSPIGPVRISANYFPQQKNPIYFHICYGYLLFNERAYR